MITPANRLSWWVVLWGLITALSLNSVLPALDHHAAEYTPFHAHVVGGAATAAEREALLAAHQHGAGQPHQHGPTAQVADPATTAVARPAATIIGARVVEGILSLLSGGAERLVFDDEQPLLPPLALWLCLHPAALLFLKRASPPLEQPPRLF